MLGLRGRLPAIYTELEVNYFLLRRLLGVKTADGKQAKVAKLTKNEVLMVNIGSTATGAKVMGVKADAAKLSLTSPACTEIGEKIALSRRIEKHWRLIGWANIVAYVFPFPVKIRCRNISCSRAVLQSGVTHWNLVSTEPCEDDNHDIPRWIELLQ